MPLAQAWRKSRRCDSNACVEASYDGEHVYVRDSKDPQGPVFTYTRTQWQDLMKDIVSGDFGPADYT